MIDVSQNFKDQQALPDRRLYCKIDWKQIDVTANDEVVTTSSFTDTFTSVTPTTDLKYNYSNRYATLERLELNGYWKLPGLSDEDDKTWWSSNISGSDAMFSSYPTFSFTFPSDHFSPGLTIIWDLDDYEYAVQFTIRVWLDGSYSDIDVTNNNSYIYVSLIPQTYDKIELIIAKWSNPYRRARITEFLFGLLQTYDKNNKLISIEVNESIDLLNSQIFSNKLKFSIDNIDHLYDLINPDGIYQYLQQQQEIVVSCGVLSNEIYEYIPLGKFYLTEWQGNSNDIEARFVAESIFYKTYKDYSKSVYGTKTVYQSIIDILVDCGFRSREYYVDTALQDTNIVGFLEIGQAKDLLANLAIAGRAIVWEDREGVLRFERMVFTHTNQTISKNAMYKFPDVELLEISNGVSVVYYTHSLEDTSELFNQSYTNSQTQLIINYNPSTDQSATVTGATLASATYYAQVCVLNLTSVTSSINVVITGKKINTNETVVGTGNTKIESQTITNYSTALLVQSFITNYYTNRVISNVEWKQCPYMVVGDRVYQETQFTNNIDGIITENNYKFTGGFLGTTKVKGV